MPEHRTRLHPEGRQAGYTGTHDFDALSRLRSSDYRFYIYDISRSYK